MALDTRETTRVERSTEQERQNGQTVTHTLEDSATATFMERKRTPGVMTVTTRAIGSIIKCTAKARLLEPTAGSA